jgi:hypothetical protein
LDCNSHTGQTSEQNFKDKHGNTKKPVTVESYKMDMGQANREDQLAAIQRNDILSSGQKTVFPSNSSDSPDHTD